MTRGRKGYSHEIKAKKAMELSLDLAIWAIENEELDIETRLKVVIPLLNKYIPSKLEIDDVNAMTRDDRLKLAKSYLALLASRNAGTIEMEA